MYSPIPSPRRCSLLEFGSTCTASSTLRRRENSPGDSAHRWEIIKNIAKQNNLLQIRTRKWQPRPLTRKLAGRLGAPVRNIEKWCWLLGRCDNFRGCFKRCCLKTPFHGVDVFVSVCVLLFCLLYVAVCSTRLVCAVRSVSKTLARELSIYSAMQYVFTAKLGWTRMSACFYLFCLLYVAVCSTRLVCAVRSVSTTQAREPSPKTRSW